jgi:adenylosuccinate lyase
MFVYPERMMRNLESTGGLIYSGQLLLELAEAGMSREDAYRLVQSHAMNAWKTGKNFRDAVYSDSAIKGKVDRKTLDRAFDLKRQLRNVDKIFVRVFGKDIGKGKSIRTAASAASVKRTVKK